MQARGLRLLEASPTALGNAHVVAATTAHETTLSSTPPALPLMEGARTLAMPRLSAAEVATALYHYYAAGICPQPPQWTQVQQLAALTNGNAEELRRVAVRKPMLNARHRRAILSVV